MAIMAAAASVMAQPAADDETGVRPGVLLSRQLMESRQLRVGDLVRLAADSSGARSQLFRILGEYEPTPDPMRFAQRRLEFDFATHRALGDGGNVRLQSSEVGQLVDALLADHGGIHVGEKKLLAPGSNRLHDNVDRQVAARPLQAGFDRLDIAGAGDRAVEGDVDGHFVEQPLRRSGRGEDGQRAVDGSRERVPPGEERTPLHDDVGETGRAVRAVPP